MLKVKVNMFHFLKGNIIWFSAKPNIFNCLTSVYKQSTYGEPMFGYKQSSFFTKIINLKALSTDEILNNFDKKTAYEVRRALKDEVTTGIENDLDQFISYYNEFAATKGLPVLSAHFKNYKSDLLITKACYNSNTLVMHAYLFDESKQRTRLLYSASLFRLETDTQVKAIVGRANRLLHFKDICLFKEMGIEEYDLGGYALGTDDQDLMRINQFKDGFGGNLIQEYDYMPVSLSVLALFSKRFKN